MEKKYFSFDKNLNLKVTKPFIRKRDGRQDNKFVLAKYFNIGYYLITPLIIGVFLGFILKGVTGLGEFIVGGIIFGAVGTFYNLFKLTKD